MSLITFDKWRKKIHTHARAHVMTTGYRLTMIFCILSANRIVVRVKMRDRHAQGSIVQHNTLNCYIQSRKKKKKRQEEINTPDMRHSVNQTKLYQNYY